MDILARSTTFPTAPRMSPIAPTWTQAAAPPAMPHAPYTANVAHEKTVSIAHKLDWADAAHRSLYHVPTQKFVHARHANLPAVRLHVPVRLHPVHYRPR